MKDYWCDKCGITTFDVTLIALMPDGITELCSDCENKE